MGLDVWFPLGIYYEDLPDGARHNPTLAARIHDLLAAAGARRTPETASWTGDVHDVDRLHLDPAFDWLTDQVGQHARQYLKMLGHDVEHTDIYIQRSWPVVAHRGQRVGAHAHHTAHLSAVYYVSARGEAAGRILFLNDRKPNELSPGFGFNATGGYAETNVLNFGSAHYQPVAGRLLLFPAKQTHEVEPNQTDAARISISFDLVITARGTAGEGHREFLMPPPSLWRQVGQPAQETAARPATPRAAANGRSALRAVSTHGRDIDAFAIPDHAEHVLWEPAVLAHCSSPAAWQDYAAMLAAVPPEDWSRDDSEAVLSWSGCADWRVYRDAVDRLYAHLRDRDVPLEGATVTPPVLEKLVGAAPPHRRGRAHLNVYVRIDHDGARDCELEFAEGGSVALAPGVMIVAGGCRRQRLRGAGHVIRFGLDVPCIARAGALELPSLQSFQVADNLVFAAIAAQPIGLALPPLDVLSEKLQWLDDRARRRNRNETCPAVRRFLLEHADPASATAAELDLIRGHGTPDDDDGRLIENIAALSAAQCETLRRFADAHMTSIVPDTVDDLPEYQVNLSVEGLAELVGGDTAAALLKMPERFGAPADRAPGDLYERIDIFLRMYSPQSRPYIAFHSDTCSYTVNIALNDDAGFDGGELLVMSDAGLKAPPREPGTAILHAGNLVHGVSRIERGTRYSLIMFFSRRAA